MKNTKYKTAIYPGTFDPVTYGHLDIIKRAAQLFDTLIVAVSEGSAKKTIFTPEERVSIIKKTVSGIRNVRVTSFKGLLASYAKTSGAFAVIRGLRTISDYEYEFQMALTNRKIEPKLETVFLATSENYSYISSTLVREISLMGGDVSKFVPPVVRAALKKKIRQ